MRKFIGTKLISAEPLNLGDYNIKRGWAIPENEDPKREGYYLVYPDGYESWSPKEIFEEAYRETSEGHMTFGMATEAAKKGLKVARKGWNGAGMFAYIVPANSYPAQTEAARSTFGEMVPYRAYWALKTAQNDVAAWSPSGSDSLADDWMIVEPSTEEKRPPHQQRVIDEHAELKDRSSKLSAFILDNPLFLTLAPEEQSRMRRQNDLMAQYVDVLSERIAAF